MNAHHPGEPILEVLHQVARDELDAVLRADQGLLLRPSALKLLLALDFFAGCEGIAGDLDGTVVDMTLRLDNADALPPCPTVASTRDGDTLRRSKVGGDERPGFQIADRPEWSYRWVHFSSLRLFRSRASITGQMGRSPLVRRAETVCTLCGQTKVSTACRPDRN
jgi:hypothetical protein